jgi:DNA adenine methylase
MVLSDFMRLSSEPAEPTPSPFVKWAGGKGSLVRDLLKHAPSGFAEYHEPFLGGGAFFFALYSRKVKFKAHLSDANSELIHAYETIRDEPEGLISILSRFQSEYDNAASKSAYYYDKRMWNPTSRIEAAARLVFLNKTCYNGLYRVNSRGEFNVPFGRYINPRIVDADNLRSVSRALHDTEAELLSSDFKMTLGSYNKNDLVYFDPPYQPVSRTSSFTDYTPSGFAEEDQERLAEVFGRLVRRGCTVLLSNSDTPLTRRLYSEFDIHSVNVNRPINSVGSGRTGHKELIVVGRPD